MLHRKSATSTRSRGNPRPAPVVTTAGKGFVEFHPSMSLENAPTLADCLAAPSTATSVSNSKLLSVADANEVTLEGVLADRFQVWIKVAEVIEKLASMDAYQGDVLALRKLQQLHLLCKQRETHLRTLQLTLLQEGRSVPRVEAIQPTAVTETDNEDDNDIDGPKETQAEWQREQERRLDFVDYDDMDLIELSERFS